MSRLKRGKRDPALEATRHESQGTATGQVFAEISTDRPAAAKLLLGQLEAVVNERHRLPSTSRESH